jgi:hypothetical protein
MNLGGRREGGKDGRTDWTNGTQGAHIKSLEEEDQKEKESPSRATPKQQQNHLQPTTRSFATLDTQLVENAINVRFTGDNAHTHSGLIFIFVHVHLSAMEKWGRRRRLSSSQEPTQTYLAYISYFLISYSIQVYGGAGS